MQHWAVGGALVFCLIACGPRFISLNDEIPGEDVPPGTGLHYVSSNENRLDLFYPHIRARRGLMIGVGTDQNLMLMSWAASSGAVLIDRDAFAELANQLHVHALRDSGSFADFRGFWSDTVRIRTAVKTLKPAISDADLSLFVELVTNPHGILHRLRRLETLAKKTGVENFTVSAELFDHLKRMATAGAIRILRADVAGSTTMTKLAQYLKEGGIPLSLVYLSNIEDYPVDATVLRHNLGLFPLRENTLLLRTLNRLDGMPYSFPENEEFAATQPFHYNMQNLENFVACGLPRRGKRVEGLKEIAVGISKIQCGETPPH